MKNKRNYKDGRCLKKYYCKNCNREISLNSALYGLHRCNSCAMYFLFKNNKNHPNYKDGRTDKKYCCIDCGKRIGKTSGIYGKQRCLNCFQIGELNSNYFN